MAKLDRTATPTGPLVSAIGPAGFRVGDRVVPGGLILTPEQAMDWAATTVDGLSEADFAPLLALDPMPEFVLLGTGPALRRPPAALIAALDARGIFLEPMDSRAAARTWGLLRAEGRQIAAALLPAA